MSNRRRVLLSVLTGLISVATAGAQDREAPDTAVGLPPGARTAISRAIASDADSLLEEAKLVSGTAAHGSLGESVAISGDTIVAAAPPAAVYVFVKPASGWASTSAFSAKLSNPAGAADDGFGTSVAISGDTVVVGAWGVGNATGAAYVFVKPASGWTSTSLYSAKLTASGGLAGDFFGLSVAIDGDTLIVGASNAKVGGNDGQGALYVFEKPASGWASTSAFAARLTAAGELANDALGTSAAISGDAVIGGAPAFGGSQSAAYVFVRPPSGWASTSHFDAKLTASDLPNGTEFGGSVAISDDAAVVGAPLLGNSDQGAAFVFEKPAAGWSSTSTFDAELTVPVAGDYFGTAVALAGRTVAVGAPSQPGLRVPGSAYVFVEPPTGWASTSAFDAKIQASDAAGWDSFGFSVAISEGTLVVGAQAADQAAGAAYVFGGLPQPCAPGTRCVIPVPAPPAALVDPRNP
ncbi:MAG TPA: hypothetical protein VFS34_09985 [Thermoanaerobaculia bacterium]|nr:hypothetical protein [Thermoanaerobaculia bacterium]